ncbi:hypothetical protein CSKR_111830 [Clonorchis sinensis]|uniref:Uncharacterized protein n=1 Tax=Clonorchis sinensis TaxID=79923 RepID=A0A419Q4J1_CLOSI|nr:hypothetical protein CSKR_111830 [Clonorchis sinensis]
MVQSNRATLLTGRTHPPHNISVSRACYQICRVTCHQAVIIAVSAIISNSRHQAFYPVGKKLARSFRTSQQQTTIKRGESRNCGRVIKLGMAAPCHHWPDILRFSDSPVTDVTIKVIGLGCAIL